VTHKETRCNPDTRFAERFGDRSMAEIPPEEFFEWLIDDRRLLAAQGAEVSAEIERYRDRNLDQHERRP
jgi:hypothetical protein